jgi:hypothetical protein
VEEESLTLSKSNIPNLYFLYYKGNPISAIIVGDGITLLIAKDSVKYIEIK